MKRQRAISLLGSITRSELGKQNKHTSLGLTAGLIQANKVYKVHRQQKYFLITLSDEDIFNQRDFQTTLPQLVFTV